MENLEIQKTLLRLVDGITQIQEMIGQLFIVNEAAKRNQIPDLLTVAETCDLLKISEMTLYNKRRDGKIRASTQGNRVYFSKEEVMRYLHHEKGEFCTPKKKKTT